VPAVLTIGLITGQPVTLGLSATSMIILTMMLPLSTMTFSGTRTTMLGRPAGDPRHPSRCR
jgi:Ca2+:H+ antiporter